MASPLNALISMQDSMTFSARYSTLPKKTLWAEALEILNEENANTTYVRRVNHRALFEVMRREYNDAANLDDDARRFQTLRGVRNFLAAALEGSDTTKAVTKHTDMFGIGHPESTNPRRSELDAATLNNIQANWFAYNPKLPNSLRPVVAAAFRTEPDTLEYRHAWERLNAHPLGTVPAELLFELERRSQH